MYLVVIPVFIGLILVFGYAVHDSHKFNVNKYLDKYANNASIKYCDIPVRFKNWHHVDFKNKYEFDVENTFFTYDKCDMTIQKDTVLISGISKFLGKNLPLTPHLFVTQTKKTMFQKEKRLAVVKVLRSNNNNFEIDFEDSNYRPLLTLIISCHYTELIEDLKKVFHE